MDIKLNDETVRAATARAILETVSQQTRDTLIANAVAKLLEPQRDRYGQAKGPTGIEDAFGQEVRAVARAEVAKMLAEPRAREELQRTVRRGLEKLLSDSKFVERVGDAFVAAFWKQEY